jgi:hypothetical protein
MAPLGPLACARPAPLPQRNDAAPTAVHQLNSPVGSSSSLACQRRLPPHPRPLQSSTRAPATQSGTPLRGPSPGPSSYHLLPPPDGIAPRHSAATALRPRHNPPRRRRAPRGPVCPFDLTQRRPCGHPFGKKHPAPLEPPPRSRRVPSRAVCCPAPGHCPLALTLPQPRSPHPTPAHPTPTQPRASPTSPHPHHLADSSLTTPQPRARPAFQPAAKTEGPWSPGCNTRHHTVGVSEQHHGARLSPRWGPPAPPPRRRSCGGAPARRRSAALWTQAHGRCRRLSARATLAHPFAPIATRALVPAPPLAHRCHTPWNVRAETATGTRRPPFAGPAPPPPLVSSCAGARSEQPRSRPWRQPPPPPRRPCN